jgi:hypothetical protein
MLEMSHMRRRLALGMTVLTLVLAACTPGASPSTAPSTPSDSGMMEHSASPSGSGMMEPSASPSDSGMMEHPSASPS